MVPIFNSRLIKERKVRTRWLILANEFLMSPAHPIVCFILTCLGKQGDENLQHLWLYLQPLIIKTWKLLVTKVNLLFFPVFPGRFILFPAVINPLHPNISIHILHTLLYTFPLILTRRICLTIKASLVGNHFPNSHDLS